MDQSILVNAKLDGGRRLVDSLPARGLEVKIAFWMMPSDEEKWFLYIASPSVGKSVGLGQAYHLVNSVLRLSPGWGIDFFDVVIVNDLSSIAVDALSQTTLAASNGDSPHPIPYRGSKLGGYPIQGAYIYMPS